MNNTFKYETDSEPTVCMRPEDLPLQRIHSVVDLPPRPDFFHGRCEWFEPMPRQDAPKGSPRNLTFLASVEWAWSPMHNRWNAYYLNPRGKYWLLWIRSPDPNEWDEVWRWNLYGWALRKGVPEKEAAIYLLADIWAAEARENNLDHFGWLNDTGMFSVAEICATARLVWPDFEGEEEEA